MKLTQEQSDYILKQLWEKEGVLEHRRSMITYDQLQKTLNRCVKAPPEEGYSVDCTNHVNLAIRACVVNRGDAIIELNTRTLRASSFLDISTLKQHIQHCQKMLAWLESENE